MTPKMSDLIVMAGDMKSRQLQPAMLLELSV